MKIKYLKYIILKIKTELALDVDILDQLQTGGIGASVKVRLLLCDVLPVNPKVLASKLPGLHHRGFLMR